MSSVDSIDDKIKTTKDNGGTFCIPETGIALGEGWIAAFMDTDGNGLVLYQESKR